MAHVVTRWLMTTGIALVLTGSGGRSMAQEHGGHGSGHRGQMTAQPPRAPSPETTTGHFASTLTFEPRPVGVRSLPSSPRTGPAWEFLSFPILWPSAAGMPFETSPAVAMIPLSDNAPSGGLQLDVQPWRAHVYVDGAYAGRVDDFTGYYHHLNLAAGLHLIAIVAPDYQPLIIDVMVSPGQTTTHRGALTPALAR